MKEKGAAGKEEGPGTVGPVANCCGEEENQKNPSLLSAGKWKRRWGCCLGCSPDFQPKERDEMVLDPGGSDSSVLWVQGRRKDVKLLGFPFLLPHLIAKLPPI
jgi:hypothetical protein